MMDPAAAASYQQAEAAAAAEEAEEAAAALAATIAQVKTVFDKFDSDENGSIDATVPLPARLCVTVRHHVCHFVFLTVCLSLCLNASRSMPHCVPLTTSVTVWLSLALTVWLSMCAYVRTCEQSTVSMESSWTMNVLNS